MSIENLLSKLDKVKRTGSGRYNALCPAHADKSPSLSVRELDDGRVLIHCFGGCDVHSVLAAAGASLGDLFPEREQTYQVKGERRPFPAIDVLRCIAFEAMLVAVAAANLMSGMPFTQADRDRVFLAAGRIQSALRAAGLSNG
jgi:hypothetical protein